MGLDIRVGLYCPIFVLYIITMMSYWIRWRLRSPASRLFTQRFIQALIKAPRHWPLWGEFTGDRWIPRTKDQLRGKCSHLMTSSWFVLLIDGGGTVIHVSETVPLWTQQMQSLKWRHNGRDGVSNHQPHDCLLNRLFKCRSKKTSKLRITGQ